MAHKRRRERGLADGGNFPTAPAPARRPPSRPSALMRTSIRLFASDCHDPRPPVRPSARMVIVPRVGAHNNVGTGGVRKVAVINGHWEGGGRDALHSWNILHLLSLSLDSFIV